jgi:SAM-dependent methyltransferase
MAREIHVFQLATTENLDPEAYLLANPDLGRVAGPDRETFAVTHFQNFGHGESRSQFNRTALAEIEVTREHKLSRLARRSPGLLRSSSPCSFDFAGQGMSILRENGASELPISMENISANAYDEPLCNFFDEAPDNLFLDLGAGLRHQYRENVVNVEIAALPTTDILAFANNLPFESEVFDGAVCLAVLEHVPDPFQTASELLRVVRPGGTIYVDWPFLQPVHGYPSHYYNATAEGAVNAFRRIPGAGSIEASVPPHMHPIFSLTWILGAWRQMLPTELQSQYSELTVSEILALPPEQHLEQSPWVSSLAPSDQRVLSAGTRLRITRS